MSVFVSQCKNTFFKESFAVLCKIYLTNTTYPNMSVTFRQKIKVPKTHNILQLINSDNTFYSSVMFTCNFSNRGNTIYILLLLSMNNTLLNNTKFISVALTTKKQQKFMRWTLKLSPVIVKQPLPGGSNIFSYSISPDSNNPPPEEDRT